MRDFDIYGVPVEASVVGYTYRNRLFGKPFIRLVVKSEYGDEFMVDTKCKDICKYPRKCSVLIRVLDGSAVLV